MNKLTLTLSGIFITMLSFGQETETAFQETKGGQLILWAIILVCLVFLISMAGMVILRATQKNYGILESNIDRIKAEIKANGDDPDLVLTKILVRESKLYREPVVNQVEKEIVEVAAEADHSFALKVADELVRIQKNLSNMDESTRGLKQLAASVDRIRDNFAANGYELVDMLNKPYREGMKVAANFIPSEDLATGEQLITRIIKPQVNYQGEMIQSAQIEVSVGE